MRCVVETKVKRAGIYNVSHLGHRPPHKAVLQEGEAFPECRCCGTAVVFEYFEPVIDCEVEHIGYDPDFMESVLPRVAKAA